MEGEEEGEGRNSFGYGHRSKGAQRSLQKNGDWCCAEILYGYLKSSLACLRIAAASAGCCLLLL